MRNVELRPAGDADCVAMWAWNNEPEVRRVSVSRAVIELREHQRWFQSKLSDPHTQMYIVTVDGIDVGVVRLDYATDECATISVAVDKHYRGHGVGGRAIALACALSAGHVEALILASNESSIRCFENVGFERRATQSESGRDWAVYTWRRQ